MNCSDDLHHFAQNVFNNSGTIRCVKCGFPGHQNDAPVYALPPDIAKRKLPFPEDCVHIREKHVYLVNLIPYIFMKFQYHLR